MAPRLARPGSLALAPLNAIWSGRRLSCGTFTKFFDLDPRSVPSGRASALESDA